MSALQTCTIDGLQDQLNPGDIRRDLHVFVRDVCEKGIKRAHRSNSLPKSVSLRLAKKMSIPDLAKDVQRDGASSWIDYVDYLAAQLGITAYDTKGVYAGWTSSELSYPDNYVEINAARYSEFLELSLAEQEEKIRDSLVNDFDCSDNELFSYAGPFSSLDSFPRCGCATGVVPKINFANARERLFKFLSTCDPGVWYSTASLIARIKEEDPHFLIPKKLRHDDYYQNFRESPRDEYARSGIKEKDPLGFEKVEGRFIERFLEGIPMTLGYVETAYDADLLESPIVPSMGALKAFRVTQLGHVALTGEIAEPELTILPDHEIHVASLCHSERVYSVLATIAKLKTSGLHSIYKLNQRLVTKAAAEGVSAIKELSALTDQIPENIQTELRGWEGRGDVCTIYCGYSLAEGPEVRRLGIPGVTAIADDLVLAPSADDCHRLLEIMETVPKRISHQTDALKALAPKAKSRFAGKATRARAKKKQKTANIYRSTEVKLRFENGELFDAFCSALLEKGVAVLLDRKTLTATFSGAQEPQVQKALDSIPKQFNVQDQ